MVETYGLTMKGLKATAGATKGLRPYGEFYVVVYYDIDNGEVWHSEHIGFDRSWYRVYNSKSILQIGTFDTPISMQGLADLIHLSVKQYLPH